MNSPTYPEYKATSVDWLDPVPSHWSVDRLKWHLSANDGGVWGEDEDEEAGTVVLRSTEQTLEGRWQIEDPARRKLSRREKLMGLLHEGDLLVTKSSGSARHIGKTTLVDVTVAGLDACFSNFMQRLRTGNDLRANFAWYLLNSEISRVQFGMFSNSTTGLANLNGTMIGSLEVPVPPLNEQQAISGFLDRETGKIDALVAEQEKLIELLKEKRQAVIFHLITKGLNPDAPTKESGIDWLGEVPAHWVTGFIRVFAQLESGHTPSRQHPEYWDNCTIPWFSLADVWQIRDGSLRYVSDTKERVSELGLANSSARLLPKGTVMLSRTASVGFSAIMGCDMATTQDFANWVCGKRLLPEFLLYALKAMKSEFERLMMGSTHKTIYMPDIAKLMLAVPPLEEQEAIISELDQSLARLDTLQQEAKRAIELLKERRSSLISAAVTGKIDVRGLVDTETTEAA